MDEELKKAAADVHSRILHSAAPLYGANFYGLPSDSRGWPQIAETARALAEHVAILAARVERLELERQQ